MKYIWTTEDIVCGRIVCKPKGDPNTTENGWDAKWAHKIGFLAGGNPENPDAKGEAREDYILIAMTDGMVCKPKTKAAIAKFLNSEKMIPMPHSRLLAMMEHLRDVYET